MPSTAPASTVVELRQYTLHEGQRDVLIDLFEREFIESQQAVGMTLPGLFRDLDRPDRFVWLRAFPDMPSRAQALGDFYGGPVWKAHRDAANATMIDSDDVLLLTPADGNLDAPPREAALVLALLWPQEAELGAGPPPGARWCARLATHPAPNNFPRLPVRDEAVQVVLLAFDDDRDEAAQQAAIAAFGVAPREIVRLAPTARSAIAPKWIGRPGDFDFLVGGRWEVSNACLKQRHVGSNDWDRFDAVCEGFTHLGGAVSVDEIRFPAKGTAGCTVRTLERAEARWAIYWISSRAGLMFPPVRGGWIGDRGEFYGDDDDEGRPIRVRFVWERLGPDAARWSQAFSLDGRAWETNWVMNFRRITAG